MRYTCLLILFILVSGCSNKSDISSPVDDNLLVNIQFPMDPLIETVTSCKLKITAVDLSAPSEKSVSITAEPGGTATVSAFAPIGDNRLVTIYLLQPGGGAAFWANQEVDIPGDSTAEITLSVIQAAANSALRIKIFRDDLPWNSQAMENALDALGMTFGTEDSQYQIISSTSFNSVTLIPGEDLVIIANDQSQEFYDNYRASQARIESFVRSGGTILWEACDRGWNDGSIGEAGIDLPGDVRIVAGYESRNYLTSSLWQITSGLDSTLYGNYASHEGFMDLPQESVIYTIDGRRLATLVSYSYGAGWVILTGQPLEYSYDRIDSLNSGYLLPNIIRHVMGIGTSLNLGIESLDNDRNISDKNSSQY